MDESSTSARGESEPVFEGFAVGLAASVARASAAEAVAGVLGADWHIAPIGSSDVEFDVTHPQKVLSESEAWEAAYRLRTRPELAYAEPLFAVSVFEGKPPGVSEPLDPFEAAESVVDHLSESDRPDWGLEMIRVMEAWNRFFGGDPMRAGAGVVIGHPDTGYQDHPEILDNLLIDLGYDFVGDRPDARDDLRRARRVILDNPSHGTGTASVIVSPRGPQASYLLEDGSPQDPSRTAVSGVAPGANLIPIRTSRTVALTSMRGLVRAIHHAADSGAHVISISMGGVPSEALKRAVRYAEGKGVIVCAAAGNQVRFVVWPAMYEEVVAAAACNAVRQPWKGSSRGSRVTATAPGESVWRAHASLREEDDGVVLHVGRGSGTSYAVAHIAGLAALWLSHHGRDALIASYGMGTVPRLFRQGLRESCVDSGLGKGFGAGLVDAVQLLEAPLPPAMAFEAAPSPALEEAMNSRADRAIRNVQALFDTDAPAVASDPVVPFEYAPTHPRVPVSALLALILNVPADSLEERMDAVGDELIFHLMTHPSAFDAMREAMSTPTGLEAWPDGPGRAVEFLRGLDLSQALRAAISRI